MDEYIGSELELFENATNWKKYFRSHINPYIKGDVLEVGAGIGGTTRLLCDGSQSTWTCLEPDKNQAMKIGRLIENGELPNCCESISGTIDDLPTNSRYDTIMYIDVLEHIENDGLEVLKVADFLKADGTLIILVPAFQHLFSPFDQSVGHYRRYNKDRLRESIPKSLKEEKMYYLDSMGVIASLANKYILKKPYPTAKDIQFWDNVIIRLSKVSDIFIKDFAGKSLIGIWAKD